MNSKILIVDDDHGLLTALQHTFEIEGYQVFTAGNGQEAIRLVHSEQPDLLILDVMMPQMDGFQVCEQLKADEQTRDIPVVFLSAAGQVLSKTRAFSVGGIDYITKPFQIKEMLARVKTHLTLRAMQKQLEHEIAERRQAEATALEANRLLETVFDHTHILVAYLDPQFSFIQVNRAYAKADGREPSFFLGKNHFDLYPDAESEGIFRRVVETGEPFWAYASPPVGGAPFESPDRPGHGTTYWDWSLIPIKNTEGIVTGLILTLADVTERARLEEEIKDHRDHLEELVEKRTAELRASEERFRTVADFTYDWEYWVDPNGHFVYVSPACERITGYRPEEFVETPELLIQIAHPDDLSLITRHARVELGEEEVHNVEFQVITQNGEERWINHVCQPVHSSAGEYLGRRASNRDITKRKRAENALRQRHRELALLNQAGQAFSSTLDLDQVFTTVLEEVRRLMRVIACSIWLIDAETGELVCQQATGPKNELVRGWRLPSGEGIAGWVALNGESLIVPDTLEDERYYKDVDQQTELWLRSIATIPLQVKQDVIGVLQVVDTEVGRFDTQDLALLEPLVAAASIAIENARLYAAERAARDQLRALTVRLTETEEAERQRLARELHDQAGQNLTALSINLKILQTQISTVVGDPELVDQLSTRLVDTSNLVNDITTRIRNVMDNLRPPALEEYGLVAALRWYGDEFATRTNIVTTVHDPKQVSRLPLLVETALFRIAQEALTNVARHAQATRIEITVEEAMEERGRVVRMVIADDGVGFDPQRPSQPDGHQRWGLQTMTERAWAIGGTCCIESAPGKGTNVVVEVVL
jgi:PAS domain S-box-containing protein